MQPDWEIHPAAGEAYVLDDGASENSAGWNVDGDFMWLNQFTVTPGNETLTAILTTWGHPGDGLFTTPGLAARVFVYEDPDDDGWPDDAVKIYEGVTTIEDPDTGLFQRIAINPTVVSGSFFVAVAVHTPSEMYPAPWDGSSYQGRSWYVADRTGINSDDLTANEYPVQSLGAWGNPGNWLLRADTGSSDADGDGVADDVDVCPRTTIPESAPTVYLEEGRFALANRNQRFDTMKDGKLIPGPRLFRTSETGGCSCAQIVRRSGAGTKHMKYGCGRALMNDWIAAVSSAGKQGMAPETLLRGAYAIEDDDLAATVLPTAFALDGNYPNPFNPITTIRFDVPETASVRLSVFNVMGQEVRVLVQGTLEAGRHEAGFDAEGLPSGTYLYRLTTPTGVHSRTMVLLK